MPSIGPAEIVIILVLALLVFGPKRLPEMGRSLGRGVREFKKAADSARKEFGVDEIERELKGVKKTLGDVKGDFKVDIDAKAVKPAAADAAAAGAVAAAAAPGTVPAAGSGPADEANDEVLVGDVVEEGDPSGEAEAGPVEEAVIDEPVDVTRMTDGWVEPSVVEDGTATADRPEPGDETAVADARADGV